MKEDGYIDITVDTRSRKGKATLWLHEHFDDGKLLTVKQIFHGAYLRGGGREEYLKHMVQQMEITFARLLVNAEGRLFLVSRKPLQYYLVSHDTKNYWEVDAETIKSEGLRRVDLAVETALVGVDDFVLAEIRGWALPSFVEPFDAVEPRDRVGNP